MRHAISPLKRLALLWLCAALAACATTEAARGDDGASCDVPADCVSGLTCKASRCTPLRSRVGQVCVTDKGCEDGLRCLSGRCSVGRATPEDNARACQHLRGLMMAATRLADAQSGQHTPEDQLALEMDAFALECRTRFGDNGATVEKVACVEAAKTLEQVTACP